MVKKVYDWADGAELGEHSKRKHKILKDYFRKYLEVRCSLPVQQHFRLAIVDGFAGGGVYKGGEVGSPVIFLNCLSDFVNEINVYRKVNGCSELYVECLLLLNDSCEDAINSLKSVISPIQIKIKSECKKLDLSIVYYNDEFNNIYKNIKSTVLDKKYKNVLFNLDQCGYTQVDIEYISDIMKTFSSAEIFYTFMIKSLISYLSKDDLTKLRSHLDFLHIRSDDIDKLNDDALSKNEWLGRAEQIVYFTLKQCSQYVSTFSIVNPDGCRYWLIHFANNYRARQVYNNVLHDNANYQGHFGHSGLNMLSYNPDDDDNLLYVFDKIGRETAKKELMNDIPRFLSGAGDATLVGDFYQSIYNDTPAHSDDINSVLIDNPDLEVIIPGGGKRRKHNTIKVTDIIKFKDQKSFFSML